MKLRLSLTLIYIFTTISIHAAFTFKAGNYYFDNSTTAYAAPQFVVGNASQSISFDMDYDKELGFWAVEMPVALTDIDGYFFTETYKPQGDSGPLEQVAAELDAAEVRHTDIEIKYPSPQRVFFPFAFMASNPERFSNSGYWRRLDSFDLSPTGTLPVLYVNTTDAQPVNSKNAYLEGSYYLDPMGLDDVEAVGSPEKPLALQIKGRGNATWNKHYKKPYRVKFDKKAEILGMKKSKHFVLMPHADMNQPYVFDEVGFEVARHLGMPWTPTQRPVELVLNGEYEGIYWVTEKIRVDADRVNIVEQKDNETDPELITGGWLMEMDNIPAEVKLWVKESDNPYNGFGLSFETPEEFSDEQYQWIKNYINTVNAAIYRGDYDAANPEWEKYIDLDDAVRYYIAKEVTHDVEGFSGSVHMYKDLGDDAKLHFGPVWDFGSSFYDYANSYNPDSPCLILDDTHYTKHWIQELVKYERFQRMTRYLWTEFYYSCDWLEPLLARFEATVAPVIDNELKRWDSRQALRFHTDYATYCDLLRSKIAYLNGLWDLTSVPSVAKPSEVKILSITSGKIALSADASGAELYDIAGRRQPATLATPREVITDAPAGIYMLRVIATDGAAPTVFKVTLR